MAKDLSKIVTETTAALGYEMVDLEATSRGLIRLFIDHPSGISVGDCEKVSNHLLRVFAVEEVEFDRLEVSSPGLDRPLKSPDDFKRFSGSRVKVRLNAPIAGRKRFDALLKGFNKGAVELVILEQAETAKPVKGKPKPAQKQQHLKEGAHLDVPLELVEKIRLNPDF